MIHPEIVSYIKIEKEKNTPESEIRSNLLANGWSEQDIAEAVQSLPITKNIQTSNPDLKKHEKEVKWRVFCTLLVLDLVVIVIFKLLYGTYGLFGISLLSIVLRVLVIFLVASFTARGSKPQKTKWKETGDVIVRIVGAIILVPVIAFIALFAFCVFSGGPKF